MKTFIAIDFETANPKRVSACALGYVVVEEGLLVGKDELLIKPIGGHAEIQTRIHGIGKKDTSHKPNFGSLYPSIAHLFDLPIVGYSSFDKQVLNALAERFDLGINFTYSDCCAIARRELSDLRNHKLPTVARHLQIPPFEHHNALADAKACAEIFLRLQKSALQDPSDAEEELQYLISSILQDGLVAYKEACQLLGWLEDNAGSSQELNTLKSLIESSLADDALSASESEAIRAILKRERHWNADSAMIPKSKSPSKTDPSSQSQKRDDLGEMSTVGCL